MFTLDIETRPQENLTELFTGTLEAPKNYKDPEKINEYLKNKAQEVVKSMSIYTDYADIVCIGVKEDDKPAEIYEPKDLEALFERMDGKKIITFNGKSFDLPVLIKYGIKNGLDLPYARMRMDCRKWSIDGHYDLMEIIGGGKFRSLDEYAQIYLGTKKVPIDFATASDEELRQHCKDDVDITYKLFTKFQVVC